MSTEDFIIELFLRVDSMMVDVPKHPQAHLYPSEIVTLALLFALKGVGPRPFYRWIRRDYRHVWPGPCRIGPACSGLIATHADWADTFLAQPTTLGVADTYGVELIPSVARRPCRSADRAQGAVEPPLDRGGEGGVLGQPVRIDCGVGFCGRENAPDNAFRDLIADFQDQMVVLTDTAFQPQRRGSTEPESVQTWDLERTHGGGDHIVPVDRHLTHLKKG